MAKKKKINSRDKGQRGERALVKKFSEWWGADFHRTPGSGSFATRGFKHEDMSMAGDLMTTDKQFPFCVEVKWQESWHMEQLLKSDVCAPWQWWKQAVDESFGQIPLLVFKRNRQPWYYMVGAQLARDFIPGRRFILCEPSSGLEVAVGLASDLFKMSKQEWLDAQIPFG